MTLGYELGLEYIVIVGNLYIITSFKKCDFFINQVLI